MLLKWNVRIITGMYKALNNPTIRPFIFNMTLIILNRVFHLIQDPMSCLLLFLQYTKYIRFFVLQVPSLRILNLVLVANRTKNVFSKVISRVYNYYKLLLPRPHFS